MSESEEREKIQVEEENEAVFKEQDEEARRNEANGSLTSRSDTNELSPTTSLSKQENSLVEKFSSNLLSDMKLAEFNSGQRREYKEFFEEDTGENEDYGDDDTDEYGEDNDDEGAEDVKYEKNEDDNDTDPCIRDETFEEYEEEIKESESESVTSSETISSAYSKLSPFTIKWSFGVKTSVEIINLTNENNTEVFFASSHFGIIYNYRLNKMRFLPGHNFPIKSISADATGRWLVSADSGDDTVIIIWDNKRRVPAWSLYNVFTEGVKTVKISQDARFLAAVKSNFPYALKFWKWTLGFEKPDGVIEFNEACGAAKHIDFNHKKTEQFAVTMKFKVIFCEWVEELGQIKSYTPEFESQKKKVGTFKESLFLDDNHTVLTSTNTGCLVVWCDIGYSEFVPETTEGSIEKKYLKSVKIHNSGITSLRLCDKFIASSSQEGVIYFHDQQLRLVYMLPKLKLNSVVAISFNISDSDSDPFDIDISEIYRSDSEEEVDNENENESELNSSKKLIPEANDSRDRDTNVNDYENSVQVISRRLRFQDKLKQIPSDCTVEMKPFIIRDFVFLTKTGRIGYLSHKRKKIIYFLYKADAPVLSLNCNPNKNHVAVSYSTGRLILYHYISKKLLTSVHNTAIKITSLQFSHYGHILAAGTENGTVMELDPLLLTVKGNLSSGKSSIKKMCFSSNDDILAYYDQQSTVHVCAKTQGIGKKKWISMGKYASHYKPITDILFEVHTETSKRPRLFTIGEDRMLVEYDMANLEPNKLKLLNVYRIEQTAIPYCFTWHPKFYSTSDFLMSNSEFKLKVVDSKSHICQKTTVGPTADSPIKYMAVLPESEKPGQPAKMLYTTDKHIGIKILPSTGNPFEAMGMVAHPEKLIAQALSQDCKYLFTAGINDSCVLMWELNLSSVDIASHLGGEGLEPFVSLIEGGSDSFFFSEIEDFFYYAQIIHQGEDPNLDRSVSKNLALCEIPDLFRALGYYPTDYEIDNLIYELKHIKYHETGETVSEVTFDECVKAFLNHKPVQNISLKHINNALTTIADLSDPADILVERSELYKALEERAEAMDHKEVLGYLCILLLPQDENNPIPATLSLNDFAANVLGIDLTVSEENVKQITHSFEAKTDIDLQ